MLQRTATDRSTRIPAIDGLRAVAILVVMVSHAGMGWIVPGGFGVTIFVVLSGYLITTLLRIERKRSGRIAFGAFYARRAVRILPPLYLTMALVAVLIASGLLAGTLDVRSTIADLLFLTNYAEALGLPVTTLIPLWSIDVEEHFYLLFPLLFAALAGLGGRRLGSGVARTLPRGAGGTVLDLCP